MQQRTWRRRNYFIRKDFQGKFILRFFLTVVIGAVIFTFILSIFSAHTVTVTYEDSYLRLDKTPKALFFQIIRASGVYIFLLGIGISVISLFLSHRIAGPLYRLERSVEEITKGNLSFKITLRRRDEAQELAGLMNTMIRALSDQIKDIRGRADIIHGEILSLSERLKDEKLTSGEIKESISDTMHSVENLKESLSFFKLEKE